MARGNVLSVRLAGPLREHLAARAKAAGTNVSGYVRALLQLALFPAQTATLPSPHAVVWDGGEVSGSDPTMVVWHDQTAGTSWPALTTGVSG